MSDTKFVSWLIVCKLSMELSIIDIVCDISVLRCVKQSLLVSSSEYYGPGVDKAMLLW